MQVIGELATAWSAVRRRDCAWNASTWPSDEPTKMRSCKAVMPRNHTGSAHDGESGKWGGGGQRIAEREQKRERSRERSRERLREVERGREVERERGRKRERSREVERERELKVETDGHRRTVILVHVVIRVGAKRLSC